MRQQARGRTALGAFLLALALALGITIGGGAAAVFLWSPAAQAQRAIDQPANAVGRGNASDEWRLVRKGIQGEVSIPNQQAGVLIQSDGQTFRSLHNGPLSAAGAYLLLAVIAVLALFFMLRGRIRIEKGRSGRLIARFTSLERVMHWLTASSFVLLALSGLNMLYGRYVLRPIVGPTAFAELTRLGKYCHNYLAFAFMIGIVLMFILWARDNIPDRYDLKWFAKGGGMVMKGVHPPARKFNGGEKVLFWLTILGGVSVSFSGIALLFPFHFFWFSNTFGVLNLFGAGLPTDLTPLQDTQLSELWHATVALLLIGVVIAHIYIGTVGMEGGFDAMNDGKVDANWAEQHHSVWVAEMEKRPAGGDD
jgi:formate dehydrogenase subunit gamma